MKTKSLIGVLTRIKLETIVGLRGSLTEPAAVDCGGVCWHSTALGIRLGNLTGAPFVLVK